MEDRSYENIKNMQPLVLAFIGDGVHTLFVREHMAKKGDYKVNELNRMVKEKVNAGMQCKVFKALEDELTLEEHDIAYRARNGVKGQSAKNYSMAEYNYATAFEALVGYLYLTKNQERLSYILEKSLKEN
ncbi:MAG: Mini-ribonuclease 3 [Clostridia bacterium]|nr:Mini-ribonuclease 3 [Clostridia bacterium]